MLEKYEKKQDKLLSIIEKYESQLDPYDLVRIKTINDEMFEFVYDLLKDLNDAKEECEHLEHNYDYDISRLEDKIESLEEKIKELESNANNQMES